VGLDPNGSNETHVLSNQVRGFGGAGIAILAPVQHLIIKLNMIDQCALGILMSDDGEAGEVSIENNHVSNINGAGDSVLTLGLTSGIAVLRTASATLAGNTVTAVSNAAARTALTTGILLVAVQRARIQGNEIARIGPAGEFGGVAAGIMVRAPYVQADITNNHVERDAEAVAAPGDSSWVAASVLDNLNVRAVGDIASDEFVAVDRAGTFTTLRVDDAQVLVLAGARAFVATTPVADAGAGGDVAAAVRRGSAASVHANTFVARGRGPALQVLATDEALVSDNRCQLTGRGTIAVRITSPVVVLNANRVRGGRTSIAVSNATKRVAAVGNITTNGISVAEGPLPAPWSELNIVG
jgi:hypothetical protein